MLRSVVGVDSPTCVILVQDSMQQSVSRLVFRGPKLEFFRYRKRKRKRKRDFFVFLSGLCPIDNYWKNEKRTEKEISPKVAEIALLRRFQKTTMRG